MNIVRWNEDKKHRCPECHTATVTRERPHSTHIYTCCRCGQQFTRWPRLSRVLRDVGIQCEEHDPLAHR